MDKRANRRRMIPIKDNDDPSHDPSGILPAMHGFNEALIRPMLGFEHRSFERILCEDLNDEHLQCALPVLSLLLGPSIMVKTEDDDLQSWLFPARPS